MIKSIDVYICMGRNASGARRGRDWPAWAQVLMSLVLIYHVAAMLAAALATAPSSGVERRAAAAFRPYYELVNQGYGYRYYSRLDGTVDPHRPNPWSTPIIVAELSFEGRGEPARAETFRIPDGRGRPWPRLRYQRQLDLAYHLASDPRWAASYARHLCKEKGCTRVILYAQQHRIPDLGTVRLAATDPEAESVDLDHESTYGPRLKLGEFRCEDF